MPEESSAAEILFTAYMGDQQFTTPEAFAATEAATGTLYEFIPKGNPTKGRAAAFEDAVAGLLTAASREAFMAGLRAGLSLRTLIEK